MRPASALITFVLFVAALLALPSTLRAEPQQLDDVLMRALVDELNRSMEHLVLKDLPPPYYIQYVAQDRVFHTMNAFHGGLLGSTRKRARRCVSRVRVGSYELDNTNVGRGFGGRGALPLEDDYAAIRHALWRMADGDYKRAVEMLTRKEAYLKSKTVEDRPDDFTAADPVVLSEARTKLSLDTALWEKRVTRLSARLKTRPEIQISGVQLFAGVENRWIVNSEGTRLRTGDTGAFIKIDAQMQAKEGMLLTESLSYLARDADEFPPMEQMLADIDEMCVKLIALSRAPVLDHYVGPVLFEPAASGRAFETLLGGGICARPIPLGRGGSWGTNSLEKKLGLRILPRSFQVYDDPRPETFDGKLLAGWYLHDDEAVPARRVQVVKDGKLMNMLASRAPTKKVKISTGHGRSESLADARAHLGCLYISDKDGVTEEELKEELIGAAREEGLAFGLRIESLNEGGGDTLGAPIRAFRVYVEDGREELIRGLEFLPTNTRELKKLLASGTEQKVYNSISGIASSIIAPAVLFEELELTKNQEEFDKPPILKSPANRTP